MLLVLCSHPKWHRVSWRAVFDFVLVVILLLDSLLVWFLLLLVMLQMSERMDTKCVSGKQFHRHLGGGPEHYYGMCGANYPYLYFLYVSSGANSNSYRLSGQKVMVSWKVVVWLCLGCVYFPYWMVLGRQGLFWYLLEGCLLLGSHIILLNHFPWQAAIMVETRSFYLPCRSWIEVGHLQMVDCCHTKQSSIFL